MSTRIGLFEAKTHFSELVARAEGGEEVTITRHNRPVAKLVPIDTVSPELVSQRIRALGELAVVVAADPTRGGSLTVKEILAWRDEGRR